MDKRIIKEKITTVFADTTFNFDTRKRFRKFIKQKDHILDIGALSSPFTKGLNNKVTAIDILPEDNEFGFSDKTLDRLKKRPNVEAILMDAQKLDFPDNMFDVVILTEVLEHIPDDKKAAKEIRRVLKPGGYLLLTVPHLERIPLDNGIKEHFRHYLKKDLMDLFGEEEILFLKDRFKFNEHRRASFFITKYNAKRQKIFLLFLPIEAFIKAAITYIWLPLTEMVFVKRQGYNLLMVMRKR